MDKIVKDVLVGISDHSSNPNFTRGFVKGYPIQHLNHFHAWFNKEYFETIDIKTSVYCYKHNILIKPICKTCGVDVKPGSTYCCLSCSSKQPKRNTDAKRAAREAIRYVCPSCGEKTVKNEGYRCAPCGRKSQSNKMKALWRSDREAMLDKCITVRTEESKLAQSALIKKLILEGKFTPKSNNRHTHRKARYDNIPFRSTWEQRVYRYFKDHGTTLEYEKLRIPYKFEGVGHVYIVDFIDHKNKMVYEIKPGCMVDDKTLAKESALIKWAHDNAYSYIFIDENWMDEKQIFTKYPV